MNKIFFNFINLVTGNRNTSTLEGFSGITNETRTVSKETGTSLGENNVINSKNFFKFFKKNTSLKASEIKEFHKQIASKDPKDSILGIINLKNNLLKEYKKINAFNKKHFCMTEREIKEKIYVKLKINKECNEYFYEFFYEDLSLRKIPIKIEDDHEINKLIKNNFNIIHDFEENSLYEIEELIGVVLNKLNNIKKLLKNNISQEKEELKNELSNIIDLIKNTIFFDKINYNSILFIDRTKEIKKMEEFFSKIQNVLNENKLSENELDVIIDKIKNIKIEYFKNYAHKLMFSSSLDIKTKSEKLNFIKNILMDHFLAHDPLIKMFSKEELESLLSKKVSNEKFKANLIKMFFLSKPLSPKECHEVLSKIVPKQEFRANEYLSKEELEAFLSNKVSSEEGKEILKKIRSERKDRVGFDEKISDEKLLDTELFRKTFLVTEVLSQLLQGKALPDQLLLPTSLKNLSLLKKIYGAISNLNKQINDKEKNPEPVLFQNVK